MQNVITIDGPAGSGKSTISRLLAKKIGYLYLDTGAMYRAVALAAKREKIHLNDGKALEELCNSLELRFITDQAPPRLFLNGEDISAAIRSPEMDMTSSKVSAVSEVRKAMTRLQRKMAKGMTLVAEGRDMGTVVFPDAKHKFYLTASLKIRTERRHKERLERGEAIHRAVVESQLKKRDHQDETRSIAPLRPAEDAEIIDTTEMTPEQVIGTILCQLDLE
jgi:cytidylate kinase